MARALLDNRIPSNRALIGAGNVNLPPIVPPDDGGWWGGPPDEPVSYWYIDTRWTWADRFIAGWLSIPATVVGLAAFAEDFRGVTNWDQLVVLLWPVLVIELMRCAKRSGGW